jgi:TonB family protein
VTPPQPSTAEPPSELASLIRIARARLAQEQLVAPPGDSALDYLTRAQALAPDSAAVSGLRAELGTAVVAAAQLELDRVNLDRAEELLVEAQSLGVTDEQLVALEIGLVYARETIARAEQDRILAQAQVSLDAGHLFVPEEGSALAYLTEVRRLNPDHPRLAIELDALERALSAHVTNAIAAGNWARAAAGLGALDRSGADSGVLNGLRAELEFARTQERYLAEPSPASELNVVQFEPPVYPERALTRGTQGWVDLEFVVDVEGLPQNVVVTAAEPAGEFESAAVAAVSSYVYEPFEQGGRTYARRVSLRVRFALQ